MVSHIDYHPDYVNPQACACERARYDPSMKLAVIVVIVAISPAWPSLAGAKSGCIASAMHAVDALAQSGMTEEELGEVLDQMDAAARHEGAAGFASSTLTFYAYRAVGIKNPYQIDFLLSKGLFETVGPNGETN